MRFLTRSLTGVFILGLTVGLLAMAGKTLFSALEARNGEERRGRPAEERVYAVNVDTLTTATARPVIAAFGEVESARTLEIRSSAPGRIVELSDNFRDGGQVAEDEVLVRIDPAEAQSALDLALAEQAEAEAELREAEADLALTSDDLAAAEGQRELRAQALARQEDLLGRGAGTTAAVETAALALSNAEQALLGRRQSLAQAEARITRAGIALTRREISVRDARRVLEETTLTAPFEGLLAETTALRGALVGNNEKLGTLIDTTALEVAFRVSNAQYSRLLQTGTLTDIPITATLSLQDFPIEVGGLLVRSAAEVGEGQSGRLLYARLDKGGAAALRPGDFLSVTIQEPSLDGVFTIPASAVNADGEMLLVGDDDRLEAATVDILRRQGDALIVAGAPEGRIYATERLPQLGAGVKVRPVRPGQGLDEPEMIALDPDRRARLVAAVEGNTRIPAEARERMLARLAEDSVPKEMVDRLEARMGGGGAPAELVTLDPERRARLIAFVEGNERMPGDVKDRILAQLNAEQVPSDVVTRLESRMGG